MTCKLKIKGKTYTIKKYLDNLDDSIIKKRAIVVDSKGNQYTYIHSITGHCLYDDKSRRIVESYSIQQWEL